MRWLLIGAALSLACAPEFVVGTSLTVPAGFEEPLAQVRFQVLEPPRANVFDCDALARAEVDPDLFELSIVDEARIAPGERAELAELSRTASKIYFATALDSSGRTLFLGCAEVGEVEADTTLVLEGEALPVLSVREVSPLSGRLGDPNTQTPELEVLARDVLGRPIAALETRWTLVGVDDAPSGSERTRVDGLVSLRPARPARAGPFLVEVGVRWAEPILVEGVIIPEAKIGAMETLYDATAELVTGRLGPLGEPAVVGLVREGASARVVTMLYEPGQGRFSAVTSDPLPDVFSGAASDSVAFGLLDDERGARDRLVLVASSAGLIAELSPDGVAFVTRAFATGPLGGRDVVRVFPAGDCSGSSTRMMLELVDGAFAFFSEDGTLASDLFTFGEPTAAGERFLTSGCMRDARGSLHRTFVYDPGFFGVIFLTDAGAGNFLTGQWTALAEGLQIVGRRSTAPRRVLATQIELDELAMTRGLLQVVEESDRSYLRITPEVVDRAVGFPVSLGAGDVDGDGAEDLVSFSDVSRTLDETRFGLQVVLAREHRGRRVGGSIVITAEGTERVFVADFDRDGADDIALFSGRTEKAAMEVKLYRMGRIGASEGL